MLDFLKRPANPGIDPSLGRKFCQSGFVRVPEILGRRQVAAFREAAIAALPANAPPYQSQFSTTAVFEEPFRQVFRNERLIGTLRGLLVPTKTPGRFVDRLHAETEKVLRLPAVMEKFKTQAIEPMPLTPKEFDAMIAQEIKQNIALVKAAGLKFN